MLPFPTVQQIETKGLTWVNISKTGKDEMKYLEETFHFHPLHLEDCISPAQRPKLDVAPEYLFMVLLFPIYNRKTRQIVASEVDFFITSNLLVTVHNNELPPLINFFNLCEISQAQRDKYFKGNPAALLYEILSRLLLYCFPILDQISINTSGIEEHIFRGYERRMVHEILIVKRSIVNFRRIMQIHKTVINKLINKSAEFFSAGQLKLYFANLIELTDDVWDALENLRQSIEALEKTNNSLISFRLNDIMKILTIISITVLPVTLIASIFGMRAQGVPLVSLPYSFWVILGLMAACCLGLLSYFRRKMWM